MCELSPVMCFTISSLSKKWNKLTSRCVQSHRLAFPLNECFWQVLSIPRVGFNTVGAAQTVTIWHTIRRQGYVYKWTTSVRICKFWRNVCRIAMLFNEISIELNWIGRLYNADKVYSKINFCWFWIQKWWIPLLRYANVNAFSMLDDFCGS